MIVNSNSIVQTSNSDQKWNNETNQCECKNYRTCKKDYSWNPRTCICENSKYLKSIANDSVIACDDYMWLYLLSMLYQQKLTNTLAAKVTKSCHSKKVRDYYILHTVLLAIILLLIIAILYYYYAKQKCIEALTI